LRLLELEIKNVRGICDLIIKPNGKNFVAWGPNGSGKSALVDAIDFLLTGKISRLMGKGTRGITFSEHGPHIDHQPKDAIVRALIKLHGLNEPVRIERCMENAALLKFDGSAKKYINPILLVAQRGQHVLTRREILRFVTSEAGTRAQQIQELMDIEDIETVRKTLVTVQNEFEKELEVQRGGVNRTKGEVTATAQIKVFNEDLILEYVNQNRVLLGGTPVSALKTENLKIELNPPVTMTTEPKMNMGLLEKDIQNLRNVTSEDNKKSITEADRQLRTILASIRSNPELSRAIVRMQLTQLGMSLIDENGSCPLCDKAWPPGELRGYLEKRIEVAQDTLKKQNDIAKLSENITGSVTGTLASLKKVIELTRVLNLEKELSILQSWCVDLESLADVMVSVVDKYPDTRFGPERIKQLLAPDDVSELMAKVNETAKAKYQETTPGQSAWDTLTRLQVNLEGLKKAESSFDKARLSYKKASLFHDSFMLARDFILGKLYDSIRDRFVDMYRQLHEIDEQDFTAKIEPEEAGLNFEVDFYGRGTHPPHALHSEGHQDSMGLCLYLALAEHLTKDLIDLVILDDVVMSVDANHRRQICRLLRNYFPDRQFLITTHDRTWANQLRSEGIADKKGTIEFYNWHVDTGPMVAYEVDMWDRIEADLKRNNIPDAAARLRRGSEQFFSEVCDALQARVTYNLNTQWELGDWLPAAMEQYRDLLKLAKAAANSWGDESGVEMLKELDSVRAQVYTRSGVEQWAVNAGVHYNNWANFLEKDFRPVVEAFYDLYNLFLCVNCGGMLRLTVSDKKPENVRCNCTKVNLNLVSKTK